MIINIINDARLKIKKNKPFFLFLQCMLAILIGFTLTFLNLNKSVDKAINAFYKDSNIMDISFYSNVNFKSSDIIEVKALKNVKGAYLSKRLKSTMKTSKKDVDVIISNIPVDKRNINNDYINRLTLVKGKYPTTINQILVEEDFFHNNNLSLNEVITLSSANKNDLRAKKVNIVGVVKSPIKDDDSPNLYVQENEFGFDYYNELFITLKDNAKKDEVINKVKEVFKKNKRIQLEDTNDDNDYLKNELDYIYMSYLPQDELNSEIKEITDDINYTKQRINQIENATLKITFKEDLETFKIYNFLCNKINKTISIFACVSLFLLIIIIFNKINDMIKNDTKEINTLKRLGYSNKYIKAKYIMSTLLLDIKSIILGFIISFILSYLILLLYNKFYSIPIVLEYINIFQLIIILFIIVLIEILCFLINNKVKINYKKIFNKAIVIISIILIVIGIEIFISIIKIPNTQFSKIHKYDVILNSSEISKSLNNEIKNKTRYKKQKVNINKDKSVYLMVIEDFDNINKFIKANNKSKDVIITKQIAKKLNIKEKMYIKINDYNLKIDEIENNFIDNYVYISASTYKKIYNTDINYDGYLIICKNKKVSKLQSKLLSNNVTDYIMVKDLKTYYKKMLYPACISSCFISIMGLILLISNFYVIKNKKSYYKKMSNNNSININNVMINNKISYTLLLVGIIIGNIVSLLILKSLSSNLFYINYNNYLFIIIIILVFIYLLNMYLIFKKKKVNKM